MSAIWLMYHEIWEGDPPGDLPRSARAYHCSKSQFEAQLQMLRDSGKPVLSAGQWQNLPASHPDEAVVLTFDDGWQGSLTTAVELLVKYGFTATFFITKNFVAQRFFADETMLQEARRAGMEIGAHGVTHRMLTECPPAGIRREFSEVKAYLEEVLAAPVCHASMPGGDWSRQIATLAREAGYASLATSDPGLNARNGDAYHRRRVAVRQGTTTAEFRRFVHFQIKPEMRRAAVLRIPRLVLGSARYARLRRRLMDRPAEQTLFRP